MCLFQNRPKEERNIEFKKVWTLKGFQCCFSMKYWRNWWHKYQTLTCRTYLTFLRPWNYRYRLFQLKTDNNTMQQKVIKGTDKGMFDKRSIGRFSIRQISASCFYELWWFLWMALMNEVNELLGDRRSISRGGGAKYSPCITKNLLNLTFLRRFSLCYQKLQYYSLQLMIQRCTLRLYSGGSNTEHIRYSDGRACSVHCPDYSKTESWLA